MSAGDGVRAAVGAELEKLGEAIADQSQQLELIGVPSTVNAEDRDALEVTARRARAGRPPGAQNKATRQVKEFCRQAFAYDPMIEGFRWLQHTPETLARALGCTRLEAFDRLEGVRRELMRFFYAPMQPVDDQGNPVPMFNVQIGSAVIGAAGSRAPWEYMENQQLTDAAPGVSQTPVSQGEVK